MSHTVQQMANEFAKGNGGKPSHRSVELFYPLIGPIEYRLHGNTIARFDTEARTVVFDWCRWYTPTTQNHMKAIVRAFGLREIVSRAGRFPEPSQTFFV